MATPGKRLIRADLPPKSLCASLVNLTTPTGPSPATSTTSWSVITAEPSPTPRAAVLAFTDAEAVESQTKAPIPRTASPPAAPRSQVAVAKDAMARLGITWASPQKVTGPPAAAVKRSAAAGAVPMPSINPRATNGISKRRGTLMRMPSVAAVATPCRSFPKYRATVSGLIHWIASPLAKPATTMIGPRRTR